jgi:hypothetical protein
VTSFEYLNIFFLKTMEKAVAMEIMEGKQKEKENKRAK